MTAKHVQLLNPIIKRYVKLDARTGRIVAYKKTPGPYKRVPVHERAHRQTNTGAGVKGDIIVNQGSITRLSLHRLKRQLEASLFWLDWEEYVDGPWRADNGRNAWTILL